MTAKSAAPAFAVLSPPGASAAFQGEAAETFHCVAAETFHGDAAETFHGEATDQASSSPWMEQSLS